MFQKLIFFLKALFVEVQNDRVTEGSAALAFYITLATFPALISLIAIVPYLPIPGIEDFIFSWIVSNLPGASGTLLMEVAKEVLAVQRPAILSTGFMAALWASSSGMVSVMNQLDIAYNVKKRRSFLSQRTTAVILTVLYITCVLAASILVIKSDGISEIIDDLSHSGTIISYSISIVRYFIAYTILLTGFASLYYLAPNCKPKFRFVTPGSLFGSSVLILTAIGFDYYISNFSSYDRTYGSIGGIIIYMLWLYMGSFVMLLGAEINGVYEKIEKARL